MELEKKSKYRENKTLFSFQIKKLLNYRLRAKLWQKQFCNRGNLKFFVKFHFFSFLNLKLQLMPKFEVKENFPRFPNFRLGQN